MHPLAVFALRVEFGVVPGVALGGGVTPARAPYIGIPEITENFLEIFWRLFGLPRGGLRGWMRVPGILLRGCSGIFGASRTLFGASSEQNFGRF